ncbi:Uncharacterised protein [Klebsiella pneumoniae]|uniref:Uncharacterized protein n=1 Tax=Klebsiella pneumoniae TaxID=573 RepID=A0A2X3FE00_KLEPN|nr:Uncharacterised protein [Klebsiella pneumoniae]
MSSTNIYFSAKQIASMKINMLPTTPQGVSLRAKKECWVFRLVQRLAEGLNMPWNPSLPIYENKSSKSTMQTCYIRLRLTL